MRKGVFNPFSLGKFLFEEAVMAVLFFWILPQFNTYLPLWLIILIMVLYAVYYVFVSLLIAKMGNKPSVVGSEALINSRCKTITELIPCGWVKVGIEVWRARSSSGNIESGDEVIIQEVKGLTLIVRKSNHDGN
jgi:membrane-bound ClpP family serine protease